MSEPVRKESDDASLQKAAELLRLQSSGEILLKVPDAKSDGPGDQAPRAADPMSRRNDSHNHDDKPSDRHRNVSGAQLTARSHSPSHSDGSSKEKRGHSHRNGHDGHHKHRHHNSSDKHRNRSRSRSRSPTRGRHESHRSSHKSDRRSPHRGRSRSRSRDRSGHKHKHRRSRSRHRSRSRSRSRKEHKHHHRHHHHEHKKHHKRSRSRSSSKERKPKAPTENKEAEGQAAFINPAAVSIVAPFGGQPVEGVAEELQRSESGKGLVVKIKLRQPFQSPYQDIPLGVPGSDAPENAAHNNPALEYQQEQIAPGGDGAGHNGQLQINTQRLSFADEMELSFLAGSFAGGASPLVLSPRKVHHEKTLVTLAQPSLAPTPPLLPIDLLSAGGVEPLSAPTSPLGPGRTLGPIIFGSARAQGMRPYMEDRHTIIDEYYPLSSTGSAIKDDVPRCFAGVYDGHNGSFAADHAADRLHDILAGEVALRTCTGDGPPTTLLLEEEKMAAALVHSFETTDREILTRCRLEGIRGGATGVAIIRTGDILYAAHIGDSRAVMCRCGEPLRLTEDHKPNLPRERKRVEALGGRVDFARCWRVIVDPGNGRPASGLAVSRAFGDPDFKEPKHLVTASPDVMSERLLPGDSFVILASDGLWDVLSDNDACDLVSAHIQRAMASPNPPPPQLIANTSAELLVDASLRAGTMDNVTALVGIMQWT